MTTEPRTIGALAGETGVHVETIRYYERIGLLPAPARSRGGYRLYTDDHARRLAFIRRGRELGLSIDAVRELLTLASDRLRSCARVDRLVAEHLHALDHQIAGLQALRGELQRVAESCRGGGRIADCRILEAFARPSTAAPVPPCEDADCTAAPPRPAPRRAP
jgi:DNA-binding transcriptional MerR regulator